MRFASALETMFDHNFASAYDNADNMNNVHVVETCNSLVHMQPIIIVSFCTRWKKMRKILRFFVTLFRKQIICSLYVSVHPLFCTHKQPLVAALTPESRPETSMHYP